MSMDIVERLRALPVVAFEYNGQAGVEDPSLAHEAAGEIEALRACNTALQEEVERLRRQVIMGGLDVAKQEALHESAYRAGMKAGWNFCDRGDLEGYQRAQESTEYISELKRIYAARAKLSQGEVL